MRQIYQFLVTTAVFFSLSASASDSEIDRTVNMIMGVIKSSSQFKEGMNCAGVSEQKQQAYLAIFEKGYRECLAIHPQTEGDGKPFLKCFSPKAKAAFESIGVDKSMMEKCGFEDK